MTRANLRSTDLPGVFLNTSGTQCDARGIALSFLQLKAADDKRWTEIIGAPPESPAEVLRAAALDPRLPLETRLKAAKEAAPYFNKRMPMEIEDLTKKDSGGIDMVKLAALKKAEREALLATLAKLGVVF